MTNLQSKVVRALTRDPVAFPGLSRELSAWFDDHQPAGERDIYGTERWLTGKADGSREIFANIQIGPVVAAVERLSSSRSGGFEGLDFRDPTDDDVEGLQEALVLLDDSDPLLHTLGDMVRSIHILQAEPDYDISHSDPELPYSIFISVPPASAKFRELRVLESIIHEAMHLQLSLIEQVCPLIRGEFFGYSPWQRRNRPAQGLLHGLYVFAVIHAALSDLRLSSTVCSRFLDRRLGEIENEVGELDDFDDGLTEYGRELVRRLKSTVSPA